MQQLKLKLKSVLQFQRRVDSTKTYIKDDVSYTIILIMYV